MLAWCGSVIVGVGACGTTASVPPVTAVPPAFGVPAVIQKTGHKAQSAGLALMVVPLTATRMNIVSALKSAGSGAAVSGNTGEVELSPAMPWAARVIGLV